MKMKKTRTWKKVIKILIVLRIAFILITELTLFLSLFAVWLKNEVSK